MVLKTFFLRFAVRIKNGSLAEWLGGGLQNRIRRFESARNLNLMGDFVHPFFIFLYLIRRFPHSVPFGRIGQRPHLIFKSICK